MYVVGKKSKYGVDKIGWSLTCQYALQIVSVVEKNLDMVSDEIG